MSFSNNNNIIPLIMPQPIRGLKILVKNVNMANKEIFQMTLCNWQIMGANFSEI